MAKRLGLTAALAMAALAGCAPRPGGLAPGPGPAAVSAAAAREVNSIADDLMDGLFERYPETATELGLEDARHDLLTDNSIPAVRAWEAREDGWYGRLRAVDASVLAGRPEAVLHSSLLETLGSSRATRVCRQELWPLSQLTGWQASLSFLGQLQPLGTVERRRHLLTRWRAIPDYVDTEIANLREGAARGYGTPRVVVDRVIEQLDGLLVDDPTQSAFYAPATRDSTPGFAAELAEVIRAEVNPAVRRYRDYLRDEYLPRARATIAVGEIPNGQACYRALVRRYSTLDLSPAEAYETGVREMERIDAEMKAIGERSFGTGDVPALLARLREDPQYTFRSREELLARVEAAIARAKAEMPRWFGRLPRAELVVEPYPPFEEASAPLGSYNGPSEDGSRPGIYRISLYQAETQPKAPIESTAFHEAIPGHHLQIAIAQELTGTHPAQRFLTSAGFTEGWALYAERLADEMGLFSGDLDRMGLLSNEALRAARLVVDPGMHLMGWSRQQAIDYMLRHTAESPTSVAGEIDRYISWPGQATAYMLGRNEILRLRELARARLGDRFDIREFHDRVLENGSVTLPMLGTVVENWTGTGD